MFLLFIIVGCAAVAPPPGGPVDKTSPFLIGVEPSSGTTGIASGFTATLTFSERLDETTSLKGIRIAPTLTIPFKVSVKKNRMTVTIPGEIEEDQTYLITVTRDVLDEHGNKLDRTYQLAFSTGVEISQGWIEGFVYNREKSSSIVYLYRLDGKDLDSLFLQIPDYYTETDDSGSYSFSYLEGGDYQVLAFQGGMPPSVISPARMSYGVHWRAPIHLEGSQDTARVVNMRIFREVPPLRVVTAKMETSHLGIIRLTNPVHLSAQESLILQLVDSESKEIIVPDFLFQYRDGDPELRFFTGNVNPAEVYTLTLTGVQDSAGQSLSEFTHVVSVPEADTSGPIVISPEYDGKIQINPGEIPLEIQFNDVVQSENIEHAVFIQDTSQIPLNSLFRWVNRTRIQVIPEGGWRPEMEYEMTIVGDLIRSIEGVSMKDSLLTFTIEVNQDRGYGDLYGEVEGKFVKNSVIVATSAEKPSISYSTDVNSDGQFAFRRIPAAFWLLTTYQDKDGNRRYSYGRAIPFQPSEPFHVFPDTIEVRANWDLEGVKLVYPGD